MAETLGGLLIVAGCVAVMLGILARRESAGVRFVVRWLGWLLVAAGVLRLGWIG